MFALGSGAALAPGTPLTVTLTNLPYHSRTPRYVGAGAGGRRHPLRRLAGHPHPAPEPDARSLADRREQLLKELTQLEAAPARRRGERRAVRDAPAAPGGRARADLRRARSQRGAARREAARASPREPAAAPARSRARLRRRRRRRGLALLRPAPGAVARQPARGAGRDSRRARPERSGEVHAHRHPGHAAAADDGPGALRRRRARCDGAALRARIGVLGHDLFLYPELTARENLEFFAGLHARGRSRRRPRRRP